MNTDQPNERIPTSKRLADALRAAGAPALMIERAEKGHYDDYKSQIATPIMCLINDAELTGLGDIAERAKQGEFDAQPWEGDVWARSAEGKEIFKEFFGSLPPAKKTGARFSKHWR